MAFNWPRLEVSRSGKPKAWHQICRVALLMWSDFYSDSIGWTKVQWPYSMLSDHLCEQGHTQKTWYCCFPTVSHLLHSFISFHVFQSKPWWKLKTIVHWPFSATQRRKLNWVQLAGHKGITCSDHHIHSLILFCLLVSVSSLSFWYDCVDVWNKKNGD